MYSLFGCSVLVDRLGVIDLQNRVDRACPPKGVGGGILLETLGGGVRPAFQNP